MLSFVATSALAQSAGWDAIPDGEAGLVFRVLDAEQAGSISVIELDLFTVQLTDASGGLDIRKPIDKDGFVVFTAEDLKILAGETETAVSRVNVMDASGNEQRVAGHIVFNYTASDLLDSAKRVDAVLYYFSGESFMPTDTYPRGGGDMWWSYYGPIEKPLVMMVPPGERVSMLTNGVEKQPVLFLHGIFNAYPFWSTPDGKGSMSEIGDMYDAWQMYYPHDQEIPKSAAMMHHLLPRIFDPVDFGAEGVYGNADEVTVPVIAHGVGGLVARAYLNMLTEDEIRMSKLMMLGTPNHGSLLAYRSLHGLGFSNWIAPSLWGSLYDRRSPAIDQTVLGTKYMYELNKADLPVLPGCTDASLADCYLVIAGTKDESEDDLYVSIKGQEDGYVSVSSVSLLDKSIPLVTAGLSHTELAYALDASVLKDFLADGYSFDDFAASRIPNASDYLDGFYVDDAGNTVPIASDENLLTNPEMGQIQIQLLTPETDVQNWFGFWRRGGFGAFVEDDVLRFEYGCSELLGRKTDNRMRRLHYAEGHTRFDYDENLYFSQRIQRSVHHESGFAFPEGDYITTFYFRKLSSSPCYEFLRLEEPVPFRHLRTAMVNITMTEAEFLLMAAETHLSKTDALAAQEAGRLEQRFKVDASVEAMVVFVAGANADALAANGFKLIAPDGQSIDIASSSIEGTAVKGSEEGNYVHFYIPKPEFGEWRAEYGEALSDLSLSIPVASSVGVTGEFETSNYSVGEEMKFNLTVSADILDSKVEARVYTIDENGPVNHVQDVVLVAGADGTLAGRFTPTQPGTYSVYATVSGNYEGFAVSREIAIDASVNGQGDNVIDDTLPSEFVLSQNYPNPFNPTTTIQFRAPEAGHISIKVYDVMGRQVATLVDNFVEAGLHETVWSATSDTGAQLSSGMYYYVMDAPEQNVRQTRSMLLVK